MQKLHTVIDSSKRTVREQAGLAGCHPRQGEAYRIEMQLLKRGNSLQAQAACCTGK